jgi:hypothetical protein
MHSGGSVHNPPSRRDSQPISWSMAPKLFYLPTSCGVRRQYSSMTKAFVKTADELISMDSKKLAVPPSYRQQGTLKVSDAITIATSRNAPSTLVT